MKQAGLIQKLQLLLHKMENGFLVVILSTTIIIAVLQILLRNLFNSGLPWGDALVKILVLWLGLVGAMLACREHRHIRIDVLARKFKPATRVWINHLTNLLAAIVCGIMTWYSFKFVQFEYEDGMMAFDAIPAWLAESIIPFAFAVMTVRYAMFIFNPQADIKQE